MTINQLHKYDLNFQNTFEYFNSNLENVNVISVELLGSLDFENGHFFTLLPNGSNIDAVHNFLAGGILPQNPIEEYFTNGHRSLYSIKATIRNELSKLIFKEITNNLCFACIFDDVSCSPLNSKGYALFDNYGLIYEDESYYCLKSESISCELIEECLNVSNAFWHSLAIITKADLNDIGKLLTRENIHEACLKTELIMVGAYDGEGYVFWEKKPTQGNIGFFE